MIKKSLSLLGLLLLQACYSNGCFYAPQSVHCVDKGKEYPYIAQFQKEYSIGHTDSQQRWIDATQCNATKINYVASEFVIKNSRDENQIIIPEVVHEFEFCMEKKGYKRFSDCGYQSPKWSTGKCNL